MNPPDTFSPGLTDVDQLTQQDLSAIPNPTPAATAPKPTVGTQPSWWEKLLPIAGRLSGRILGTATDFIDGPLGSIAGASGGAGLGQALKTNLLVRLHFRRMT